MGARPSRLQSDGHQRGSGRGQSRGQSFSRRTRGREQPTHDPAPRARAVLCADPTTNPHEGVKGAPMLRNKINKKRAALVAVVTLALAGTAFAYWSASGTGSGTGSAADPGAQSVTVNQTSTVSNLVPGGTPQALEGDFTSTNSNAVKVSSV